MVTTEFYDGQGLGNQLWAYVVTRLISEDFGIYSPERFKGQHFIDIDFGKKPKHDRTYTEKNEIYNGHSLWPYDKELFNVLDGTKIDGNFQSYQYIDGKEDLIRSWIKVTAPNKTPDNVCVVHVRMGDYKWIPDVFLPRLYYEHAMDYVRSINPDVSFVCVSDEPELAEKFLGIPSIGGVGEDKYKASHHKGGDISIDFSYLVNARYLIIPNSSFAWWGAFLNTKKEVVIAPYWWAGYSKGFWQTKDIKTKSFTYIKLDGTIIKN